LLFSGLFERGDSKKSVQKGAFGQALAQRLTTPFIVPQYIKDALEFVQTAST
jgi:hypothetical protein